MANVIGGGSAEFAHLADAVFSESSDAQIVTPALAALKHDAGSQF